MPKSHISITRALGTLGTLGTKAMLVSMASVVAFSAASALGGCEGNNKPPMTPDGPEMDLDAAAPPAVTVPVPSSKPPAPTPPALPTHRTNPG